MPIPGLETMEPDGAMPWPLTLVEGEEHSGKAMPLHARIATPTGWTTHGDVAPGDLVIGVDGRPTEVLAVYDRGVRPVYRLTLSDGATVEACDEHLWAVHTSNDRHRQYSKGPKKGQRNERPYRVMTTAQVREWLLDGRGALHLPMTAPVQYVPGESLPLDPYLLGLLLGDGGLTAYPTFTSADPELVRELLERLPGEDQVNARRDVRTEATVNVGISGGATTAALRGLGLLPVGSEGKHLPEVYLRAAVEQRLALLQGLMDTDGGMEGPSVLFTTVSPSLAAGVRELVESLGGTAKTSTKQPSYRDAAGTVIDGKLAYRVTVRLPEGLCPFRLARKVAQWEACRPTFRARPRRTIRQVEYVGDMPVRCISVAAADHLYVAEHFVVTHNTWDVVVFLKQCEQIGEAYWIPLDESGHARMYGGRLPGKAFEIVKLKSGDYSEVIDVVRKIKAHAVAQHAAGEKPVALVIDTISGIWAGLHDWVNARHRRTRGVQRLLENDPNADVGRAGRNLWNDADERWRALVRELKTFPGLVIVTARGKEISATDPQTGQPMVDHQRKPVKTWSLETKKGFEYYVDVHLRKRREEGSFVVGVRSVEHGKKPGSEEAKQAEPILDPKAEGRELEWLLFDILGLDPKTAYVNEFTEFEAGGFTAEELGRKEDEAREVHQSERGNAQGVGGRRRPLPMQMYKAIQGTKDEEALRELWGEYNKLGLLGVTVELEAGEYTVAELVTARKEWFEEEARKAAKAKTEGGKGEQGKAPAGEPGGVVAAVAAAQAAKPQPPATGKERTAAQLDAELKGDEPDVPDMCRMTAARRGLLSTFADTLGIDADALAEAFGRPLEQIATRRLSQYLQVQIKAAQAAKAQDPAA